MPDTKIVVDALNKSIASGFTAQARRARWWRLLVFFYAVATTVALIFLAIDNASQATQLNRESATVKTLSIIDRRTQSAAVGLRVTVSRQAATNRHLVDQITNDNHFADLFRKLIVAASTHNQKEVKKIEHQLAHTSFLHT